MKTIDFLDLKINYYRNFYNFSLSRNLFKNLLTKIKWTNDSFNIFGKNIIIKRRIAWYSEDGKSYTYSGLKRDPFPLSKDLKKIKDKIEKKTSYTFNSILLNDYENGHVGMGWHSDDEKELGRNPIIASLSFGVSRDMYFRNRIDPKIEKIKISIEDGSLLIMKGKTQHYWQHSIPKRLKVKNRRINLTFRNIL